MQQTLTILVVEDEPDICWGLQTMLCLDGHRVVAVLTGHDAIDAASEHLDLALIDAKLPDLPGDEVARRLKAMQPRLRVILISGYYYPEDRAIRDGLEQGLYQSFICKPFDLADIRQAIGQIADRL